MTQGLREKWDRLSRSYDWTAWSDDHRFGAARARLFHRMSGNCLMVAAGTGRDFQFFPAGLSVMAIDVSPHMIERARSRAETYPGTLTLCVMDVQALDFPDACFDTAATACTFCSVPDPIRGLREIHRCLKPGGRLLMFEHVRSRLGPIAVMQDLMTPVTRCFGPDMNRDTLRNVAFAGFEVCRIENVYLDIVRTIEARRPISPDA